MVFLPLGLAACGGRETIRAESYDRSCATSDDCTTVLVGNPCECSCDVAAINKGALDNYTGDLDDIKAECLDELATCVKCPEMGEAVCEAGKCESSRGPRHPSE